MPTLPPRHKVEDLTPGKYTAKDGAVLHVRKSGGAAWMVRYRFGGKYHDLGLGPAYHVTVTQAQRMARDARAMAAAGKDPKATREAQRTAQTTFKDAFYIWHTEWAKKRTTKFAGEVKGQMERLIFPTLGDMHLSDIQSKDVARALNHKGLWHKKHVTANRLRQRIVRVFNHAKTHGLFNGVNPAEGVKDGMGDVGHVPQMRDALPYHLAPKLWWFLEGSEGTAGACHQFMMVTGLRYEEAQKLRWDCVQEDEHGKRYLDLPDDVAKEHPRAVYLNMLALGILDKMEGLAPDLVFPSTVSTRGRERRPIGVPLSTNALYKGRNKARDRLELPHFVPHGHRTTLREFCKSRDASWEVCEAVMGHAIGNTSSRRYDRTGYARQTAPYLDQWADYLLSHNPDSTVVPLHA